MVKQQSYREEVLGKPVEILFEVDEGKRKEFFSGTIQQMNCALQDDKKFVVTHYVVFEDGEELWFDLSEQEEMGHLKWPTTAVLASGAVKKETADIKEEVTDSPEFSQKNASVKEEELEVKTETEFDDEKCAEALKQEDDVDRDDDVYEPEEEEEDNEEDVYKLEEEDGDGDCKTEPLSGPDAEEYPVPDVMPTSISEICRYIDKYIDPGFYERQQDNRGECSSTRGKLRKFAKKEPTHLSIRHWVETKNWEPPSEEAFFALVDKVQEVCNSTRKRKRG